MIDSVSNRNIKVICMNMNFATIITYDYLDLVWSKVRVNNTLQFDRINKNDVSYCM